MAICDVCKRSVEKTSFVPGADAAICEACLRAGHLDQLFLAADARPVPPAEPVAPAAKD